MIGSVGKKEAVSKQPSAIQLSKTRYLDFLKLYGWRLIAERWGLKYDPNPGHCWKSR
jgi:hypothetical protein